MPVVVVKNKRQGEAYNLSQAKSDSLLSAIQVTWLLEEDL